MGSKPGAVGITEGTQVVAVLIVFAIVTDFVCVHDAVSTPSGTLCLLGVPGGAALAAYPAFATGAATAFEWQIFDASYEKAQ